MEINPLYLMVLLFFVLMVARMPIGFAMGISALVYILLSKESATLLAQLAISSLSTFTLLAIPFFILAGELMNRGGITERLIRFTNALLGHIRGGLAHVNVVVSIFEAGMSGVATSDVAAESVVLVPAMEKEGYSKAFSAAVTAASSTIGPVIPPSAPMVLIGAMNELSVGRLFAGGFIPGLIMALFMMIYIAIVAPKRGFPKGKRTSFRELLKATKDAFPSLLAPVIILGGMMSGIFTPTEAGVIGVAYLFIVGKFIHAELKIKDIADAIMGAMRVTAASMLIVALAGVFGWVLSFEQVALKFSLAVESFTKSPMVLLLLLNLIMLFLGCFINVTTLIVLLSPIFFPLILRYGIDPIHFGLVMVLNFMIGLLTPPVGMVTYVVTGITKCDYKEYLVELWPFLIALLAVLVLITYIPFLTLFLPNLIFGPRLL